MRSRYNELQAQAGLATKAIKCGHSDDSTRLLRHGAARLLRQDAFGACLYMPPKWFPPTNVGGFNIEYELMVL